MSDLLDGPDGHALTLSPSSVQLTTNNSITLKASGGVPPYSYILSTPINGSGESLIEGTYTSPSLTGNAEISVRDSYGAIAKSTINVIPAADDTTNVNYNSLSITTGEAAGGTALTGEFTFKNSGTENGVYNVDWEVYVSLDASIGSGDMLVDTGTISALDAGQETSDPIEFSGIWPVPSSDKTYYLFVRISSQDDVISGDNSEYITVFVTAPLSGDIDYMIQSITHSPVSANTETAISQSFTFINSGDDPGENGVYWKVYLSEDALWDGTDTLVASGLSAPLAANPASQSIDITENWPASAGIYYLIVKISSDDDIDPSNNYLISDPFTISTTETLIDYKVSNISKNYPTINSGGLCSETFDLSNIGGGDGAVDDDITWTAYASSDIYLDEYDSEINSGTLSSLNAGSGYVSVLISGYWPGAGDFYIIIEISSPNEDITENNTSYNGPYTVKDPPDYSISSANFLIEGTPKTLLSSTDADYTFVVTENNDSSGVQPIGWEIFASYDTILDENDISILNGSLSPLSAGEFSDPISFSQAIWPDMGSYYYLIINIESGDDAYSNNNVKISSSNISVPEQYEEGDEDNSSSGSPFSNITDLTDNILDGDKLNANELIIVNGFLDNNGEYDTYKITLGPSVEAIDIYAEWTENKDHIDLHFWDSAGSVIWESTDYEFYTEPAAVPYPATITGLTPGSIYYIGVKFVNYNPDFPYSLVIQGK